MHQSMQIGLREECVEDLPQENQPMHTQYDCDANGDVTHEHDRWPYNRNRWRARGVGELSRSTMKISPLAM